MYTDFITDRWETDALQQAATAELRHALADKKPILLYGAGNTGKIVATLLTPSITAFIDDTREKQGQTIEGIPVLSLEKAHTIYGKDACVIVCIFSAKHTFSATKKKLMNTYKWDVYPFSQALFLYPHALPNLFLSDISTQVPLQEKYIAIFEKLCDQRSKEVLAEHLRMRLLSDFSGRTDSRTSLDFIDLPADAQPVYIDCGAYDGDTVQDFLDWRDDAFLRIIAFEPDAANYAKLVARVSHFAEDITSKITCKEAAIWSSTGTIFFASTHSAGSAISDESNELVCTETLDSYQDLPDPLIIKLDVEGAELEALKGGWELIQNRRPILAISVYHKPNDLVELFEYIDSAELRYNYFLRCHGGDGSDLTLYCIPSTVQSSTDTKGNRL